MKGTTATSIFLGVSFAIAESELPAMKQASELKQMLQHKAFFPESETGLKKVALLESLNFGGNYDLLRDSLNLSNLSVSARTTLFKKLNNRKITAK